MHPPPPTQPILHPPPPPALLLQNPSTTFAQLPTLLAGKKMKLRYTASTKTFEAHGTGRDAFVRKGATNMNLACGAGLMHVVDNLATLKPGTL